MIRDRHLRNKFVRKPIFPSVEERERKNFFSFIREAEIRSLPSLSLCLLKLKLTKSDEKIIVSPDVACIVISLSSSTSLLSENKMIFYSRTRLLNARRDKVDRSCSRRRNGEKTLQLETDFLNVKVLTIFVLLFLSFFQNCLAQDGANSISDERCFLQAGGSTASFFVKEDLAVGSLVGQLRIKGDVGENINLTLTPDDGPLRIENQDLILTRPLDKEGIDGPSFINVDVTCHRLQTFDPGLLNRIFYMGRSVGGQVVNIISLYSDNPSSIPA